MVQSNAIADTLIYLFEGYIKDASEVYSLNAIASKYSSQPADLCSQLQVQGFLKPDPVISQDGNVNCAISILGISQINPDYIESKITTILKGIGLNSSMGNVMQLLGYGKEEFQKGFDLALEMQNRNYSKLLYSNFQSNMIVIELTLIGKQEYKLR